MVVMEEELLKKNGWCSSLPFSGESTVKTDLGHQTDSAYHYTSVLLLTILASFLYIHTYIHTHTHIYTCV